ncbi:unnamed protein product [Hermetia illucens]|uniref:Uncharacterized protein n=2 Tax=Hermetia illucens TaxID=343691 RepID=A0A7R8UQ22_HERIL|nr:unnamed protein product [Hermetia illucens]
MDNVIFERRQRRNFSLFNLVNPFWVISSLASALFRLFGFRKQVRSHDFDYLTNGLPDDFIILKYPLRYSMQSIIPHLEESETNHDSKFTQTEVDNLIQSKLNSQIEELVKMRRFRNALKPSRKHVRKILARNSEDLLRTLDRRNRERYGGKVSKFHRMKNERSSRGLRMIKSLTNNKYIDVDNAMEDVFYISDSDN